MNKDKRYEKQTNEYGVSITDHEQNIIVTGSAFCSKCDMVITEKFKASHLSCRCKS